MIGAMFLECHRIISFDDWDIYDGFSEGSGRSEKKWLINKETKEIGLFKYNKSDETTEHISEKLASDLAKKLNIPCASIDLGMRDSRIGSMSYLINKEENLIEGVSLIVPYYTLYNINELFDPEKEEYYSIEMCLKAIKPYRLENDFYRMLVFDYLIGNGDRHHSNWAILENGNYIKFCSLYDQGSSLCSYENKPSKIKQYLGNDLMAFNKLVNTQSKAIIRLNRFEKERPKHLDVLKTIINNECVRKLIEDMVCILTIASIEGIMSYYNTDILTAEKKQLISKYLLWKVDAAKKLIMEGGQKI